MLDKRHKIYSEYPMSEKLALVKWLQEYPELVEDVYSKPHNFAKDREVIVGEYVSTRMVCAIYHVN
jgi:hypothetical protein